MNFNNNLINKMRLDKYLKKVWSIKLRTVKEVADKGRIKVNGILAKSSTDLKVDDRLNSLWK